MSYYRITRPTPPNHARGRVKTPDTKFGNDQIFDMVNFDETGRRIQWSENEFLHSLALEPTPVARPGSREASGFSCLSVRRGSLDR
jgi:hypothetical protein